LSSFLINASTYSARRFVVEIVGMLPDIQRESAVWPVTTGRSAFEVLTTLSLPRSGDKPSHCRIARRRPLYFFLGAVDGPECARDTLVAVLPDRRLRRAFQTAPVERMIPGLRGVVEDFRLIGFHRACADNRFERLTPSSVPATSLFSVSTYVSDAFRDAAPTVRGDDRRERILSIGQSRKG
jgi:hypothetical protein